MLSVKKIEDIALSGHRSYNQPNFLYTQDEIDFPNDLKNDTTIAIMKPDKGNRIIIFSKEDYNKKIDNILSDKTKFELLNEDPIKITLQREGKGNRY